MPAHHILIIEGDKARLTDLVALPLRSIGLQDHIIRFVQPVVWEFSLIEYYPDEHRISAIIHSYSSVQRRFSDEQLAYYANRVIDEISFNTIDTTSLFKNKIVFKQPGKQRSDSKSSASNIKQEQGAVGHKRETKPIPTQRPSPVFRKITRTFTVPIKDVTFGAGFASVKLRLPELPGMLEPQIFNPAIVEEHDAIKNYFGNVLGAKRISVTVTAKLKDTQVLAVLAHSEEIDKIDSSILERVRLQFAHAVSKPNFQPANESPIYTLDDLVADVITEVGKGEELYPDVSGLIDDLISVTNSKHYNQLRFLSSKHLHDVMKLRFCIRPFSCVFLLKGASNCYVVWETLNTEEATYIWRLTGDISLIRDQFSAVTDAIALIKASGRNGYLRLKETNFSRIIHNYSNLKEDFKSWKEKLEGMME